MKTTIIIILLAFGMRGQEIPDDAKHFYAGAGITFVTGSIANHYLDQPAKSCLIGFGFGVAAGFGKEYIYDKAMGKGVFSYEDLATTCWGALCSSVVLRCVIDWKEIGLIPRKKRKSYSLNKDI